jgi:hypothetical protein
MDAKFGGACLGGGVLVDQGWQSGLRDSKVGGERGKQSHVHDISESPTTAFFEKYEIKVLFPAPVIPITAMTVSSGLSSQRDGFIFFSRGGGTHPT